MTFTTESKPMRLVLIATLAAIGVAMAGGQARAQILLWPGDDPARIAVGERTDELSTDVLDRMISNITVPVLIARLPPAEKATGAAAILCPGGGYLRSAIDKEGHDVARWLNSIGVAAFILKYRMPQGEAVRGETPLPLLDARRAVRLVRARADEFGVARDRIGIFGFSAGGHVAAMAGTMPEPGDAAAADPAERESSRPYFIVLVYPVITMQGELAAKGTRRYLLGDSPPAEMLERYSNERHVTAETPPTLLIHCADDPFVPVENSLMFFEALRKSGVPAALHVYERGGHGFGMWPQRGFAAADWPGRCEGWMAGRGLLATATSSPRGE